MVNGWIIRFVLGARLGQLLVEVTVLSQMLDEIAEAPVTVGFPTAGLRPDACRLGQYGRNQLLSRSSSRCANSSSTNSPSRSSATPARSRQRSARGGTVPEQPGSSATVRTVSAMATSVEVPTDVMSTLL